MIKIHKVDPYDKTRTLCLRDIKTSLTVDDLVAPIPEITCENCLLVMTQSVRVDTHGTTTPK